MMSFPRAALSVYSWSSLSVDTGEGRGGFCALAISGRQPGRRMVSVSSPT
jgi:hypothetical protein